jgi:hypothetical protein
MALFTNVYNGSNADCPVLVENMHFSSSEHRERSSRASAVLIAFVVLSGCGFVRPDDCSDTEKAAREWYTYVTGESAAAYTFTPERLGKNYLGFTIIDERRGKYHSMALHPNDCSLDYIKVNDVINEDL